MMAASCSQVAPTQGAGKDVNLVVNSVPLSHTTALHTVETHGMHLVNKGQRPAANKPDSYGTSFRKYTFTGVFTQRVETQKGGQDLKKLFMDKI
jgi:hypothetical protein